MHPIPARNLTHFRITTGPGIPNEVAAVAADDDCGATLCWDKWLQRNNSISLDLYRIQRFSLPTELSARYPIYEMHSGRDKKPVSISTSCPCACELHYDISIHFFVGQVFLAALGKLHCYCSESFFGAQGGKKNHRESHTNSCPPGRA